MEIHGGENEKEFFLEVSGHAKADKDGHQCPCAKISVLTQSLSAYLFDRLGEHAKGIDYRGSQGFLYIHVKKEGYLPEDLRDIRTMWGMLKAGLDIVEYQYPSSFTIAWEYEN